MLFGSRMHVAWLMKEHVWLPESCSFRSLKLSSTHLLSHRFGLAQLEHRKILYGESQARQCLLHELSLARRRVHQTNHVVLALDGPGLASCRKPNAPNMFVWFETSYFYGLDGENLVLRIL